MSKVGTSTIWFSMGRAPASDYNSDMSRPFLLLIRITFAVATVLLVGCPSAPRRRATEEFPFASHDPELLASLSEEGEPEELVPADARLFLRLRGGVSVLGDDEADPLTQEVWQIIEETVPGGFWRTAAPQLGMSERQLLAELFANDLTIVDQEISRDREVVVLARVRSEILKKLPRAANLERWSLHHQAGPFSFYHGESEGEGYLLAVGSTWLAFTEDDGGEHLLRLLTARAVGLMTLADDAAHAELVEQLPPQRDGVMYTRNDDGTERHAVALKRVGQRLEAYYVARSPKVEKFVKAHEAIPRVDFGPLPDDVLTAAALSVITQEIPGEALLDLLLFPKSFRDDVLPRITPPILFFLAKVPRENITPDPGFTVPVVGFALRLKDPSVAKELDRLCSGIHFLTSIGRLALVEGFFGVEEVSRAGLKYHLADFGPVLRESTEDPTIKKLTRLPNSQVMTRVAYGRIGDDYVVCTQEAFFLQWQKAVSDQSRRLGAIKGFEDFGFTDREGLVISVLTRGRELSELLDEAIEYVRKAEGEESSWTAAQGPGGGQENDEERRQAERVERPLRWLSTALGHSRSFSVQVWHGKRGFLHGKLIVLRSLRGKG